MVNFVEKLSGIKLPKHWSSVLLISGALFGICQWVTRNTCGQTTIFFRFLRFGKANFFATAVVDLTGPLVLLGLGTFSWKAGIFVLKVVRQSPACSRAGRGLQKLLSWILGIGCYYVFVFAAVYGASSKPWLGGLYAILVMQVPLHALLRLANAIYQRRQARKLKPLNVFRAIRKFSSALASFTTWSWKFFFFPTDSGHSESESAQKQEVDSSKPGEVQAHTFAKGSFKFSDQNSCFWREWNNDFHHLYPELDDALNEARKGSAGQSALKDEGPGFQLVAEIKQELEGYRLVALTVLPSSQALQPGIQYSVDSIPDAVGED